MKQRFNKSSYGFAAADWLRFMLRRVDSGIFRRRQADLDRAVHDEKGPWAVHIVEIDRADASYRLAAALGGETVYGREPLDATVQRLTRQGRTVAAALNADFFERRNRPFDGDPDGLCVIDGELVSEPMERAAFLVLKDGSFRIARARFSAVAAYRRTSAPHRRRQRSVRQKRRRSLHRPLRRFLAPVCVGGSAAGGAAGGAASAGRLARIKGGGDSDGDGRLRADRQLRRARRSGRRAPPF